MKMELPQPYVARPYRGRPDHPAMASILTDYRRYAGNPEMVTSGQIDVRYANLTNCDPANDIVVIETTDDEPVGYVRASWDELLDGSRDYMLFAPIRPTHLIESLFLAVTAAQEHHLRLMADGFTDARLRTYAPHPGPGLPATREAAWLESAGYQPVRFTASLVRPDLENIPDRSLPDGVEMRAVTPEMIRPILEAHHENFR